jgi:hypothetical protein
MTSILPAEAVRRSPVESTNGASEKLSSIFYEGRLPSTWFLNKFANTMRMVYGGPPFNEVAKTPDGEVLGFADIRRRYFTDETTDKQILNAISTHKVDGLRPFYDLGLPRTIAQRASMEGVFPVFMAIPNPDLQSDTFAGCASTLICKGGRPDSTGMDALSRAERLVGMAPYGEGLQSNLHAFTSKIRGEMNMYDPRQNVVLGDEVVVLGQYRGYKGKNGMGSGLMREVGKRTWFRSYSLSQPLRVLGRQMMFLTDIHSKVYLKTMLESKSHGVPVECMSIGEGRVLVYTPEAEKIFL